MPTAQSNGIELCYETFGNREDPALLLIMGLGAQMVAWDEEICEALVDRGFFVIRFDNRDVGQSTWIPTPDLNLLESLMAAMDDKPFSAPYLLSDMAADAAGLLDALDIPAAHVVGASMGGMIAQTLAIEHPERVLSLTSIMSTTGEQDVGQPTPELTAALLSPAPQDRQGAIEHGVTMSRMISFPEHFDEERARSRAARSYDRGFNPAGVGRQLLGIVASGSRAEGLAQLDTPTLVIHGRADKLVGFSGGERTAALVPGAELLSIDDMAHDLPTTHWATIVEHITALASRAAAAGRGDAHATGVTR